MTLLGLLALGAVFALPGPVTAPSIQSTLEAGNPLPRHDRAGDRWADCAFMVARGLGSVNHMAGTQSREAFIRSYDRGFRALHARMGWTSDTHLVAPADGDLGRVSGWSLEAFRGLHVAGRYQTQSMADLLQLLRLHLDAWLVLELPAEGFSDAVRYAVDRTRGVDPGLLGRIVPLVRSAEEYRIARETYPFASVVLDVSSAGATPAAAARLVEDTGVGIVVLSAPEFDPPLVQSLRDAGAAVYVRTVNDAAVAGRMQRAGVHGFFTDSLGTSGCR